MPNVATVLAYAPIAQYLAGNEYQKQLYLKGGSNAPLARLSRLIYIVRKSVQFSYLRDSSDPTLTATGNYLYWLCGKYNSLAAQLIASGETGQIVNPQGTLSTVTALNFEFEIGQPGSLMNPGDTVLVLNYTDIILNSMEVDLDGTTLLQNRTDRFSYSIVYNPTNVTITFNAPVAAPQVFAVTGLRFQAIAPPTPSETFFTVDTYADFIALATGDYYREFLVLNDEDKGLQRTVYQFWPGTPDRLEWIAATDAN